MSKFWTRQTGNTVPSIMENALPFIELGMQKRERKQKEEDYGLRRKWEEEDRALNRQRQLEADALAKEERQYQRGRDTKADMWKYEQADRADLSKIESAAESRRRWDIEQKDKADRSKMEDAYRDKIYRLQQKSEDVKKTIPILAMEIERLNELMPKEAGNVGQGANVGHGLAPSGQPVAGVKEPPPDVFNIRQSIGMKNVPNLKYSIGLTNQEIMPQTPHGMNEDDIKMVMIFYKLNRKDAINKILQDPSILSGKAKTYNPMSIGLR